MRATLWATAAACVVASACGSENGYVPYPNGALGTLVVDWTVANTKDPNECAINGAASIDIVVTSRSGTQSEFQSGCEDFATPIALPPDSYSATAVLLDTRGVVRTTAVRIPSFNIYGGDQFVAPIDFPLVSFF